MKKKLIFIFFLFLSACASEKQGSLEEIDCPNTFFAKDHQIFISSNKESQDIEEIGYIAELNNFSFNSKCYLDENTLKGEISILFVVKQKNIEVKKIFLPYYIAHSNSRNDLIAIQYYKLEDHFNNDSIESEVNEKEIIDTVTLNLSLDNLELKSESFLVLGFMIDDKKIKLLN